MERAVRLALHTRINIERGMLEGALGYTKARRQKGRRRKARRCGKAPIRNEHTLAWNIYYIPIAEWGESDAAHTRVGKFE